MSRCQAIWKSSCRFPVESTFWFFLNQRSFESVKIWKESKRREMIGFLFNDTICLLPSSKFTHLWRNNLLIFGRSPRYHVRRIGFTAIWRTKRSAGLPSIYVLHIAVITNPSETFVFTAIWRTKWQKSECWSKISVVEFQARLKGMNSQCWWTLMDFFDV